MSDPSGQLFDALEPILRADAGVIAAFAGSPVRIYDVPPRDAPTPYVVLETVAPMAQLAECVDGADTELTATVWVLADPPSRRAAMDLGAAVQAALTTLTALPGHTVHYALPVRSNYLIDADQKTAKGVVVVRFVTTPLTP